jgi:outer membrane lipoprotein-sorting protein
MKRRDSQFTIILLIVCASTAVAQSPTPSPTAEALLNAMVAKYRAAKTYSDSGTSETGSTWTGVESHTATFQIRFARPAFLRFELLDPMKFGIREVRTVWWSDENANQIWSSLRTKIERLAGDDLYRARWDVGAPAYHIPTLLNERYANQYFLQISLLPNPTMLADEIIEETECYHLGPKNAPATPDLAYDLWIGKDDLLVRKFRFRRGARLYEETHSNIRLDETLPQDTFRVTPP